MDGGIWRTISGRKVFIKDGQSLTEAMKSSGKFENQTVRMYLKSLEVIRLEELSDEYKATLNKISELEYNNKITKDEYDKAIKKANEIFNKRKRMLRK